MICTNCSKEWNAKESPLGSPCPHCGYSVFTASKNHPSLLSKEKEEKRQRLKALYTQSNPPSSVSSDVLTSNLDTEDPMELCRIGYLYTSGEEGYPKDLEKAFQYYERSAKAGNGMGQCNLGLCYAYGHGVPAHLGTAFYWYSQSAKNDEPRGYFQQGSCYMAGRGVVADPEKGYALMLQAGEKGYLRAYFMVAFHTYYGQGTQKDPEKAYEYMKIAASVGAVDAIFCLSMYDLDHSNFSTNYKQALKGINTAASHDFIEALRWQARFFHDGFGVAPDLHKAKEIYEKIMELEQEEVPDLLELNLELSNDIPALEEAIKHKDSSSFTDYYAFYVLGKHYFSSPDKEEQTRARELLDIATNYDIERAYYLLGCCHRDGIGGEVSLTKAQQCFRKASDGYILDASCAYALCLQETPEDSDSLEKALHLLKEGSSIGHAPCQYRLAYSFLEGLGVPPSRKLALLWFKRAKESGSEEATQWLESYYNS